MTELSQEYHLDILDSPFFPSSSAIDRIIPHVHHNNKYVYNNLKS